MFFHALKHCVYPPSILDEISENLGEPKPNKAKFKESCGLQGTVSRGMADSTQIFIRIFHMCTCAYIGQVSKGLIPGPGIQHGKPHTYMCTGRLMLVQLYNCIPSAKG